MANATFKPDDGKPVIELVCGRHGKSGKFIPKNITLTRLSRLYRVPSASADWRERSKWIDSRWELYAETMQKSQPNWTREAAEQRWAEAEQSYYDTVRQFRIEDRLNSVRRKLTRRVLQLALAA